MGRSNTGAKDNPACSAHLQTSALRHLIGYLKTVSRPLQNLSSHLPIIAVVCFVPKLASLVSTFPAPSYAFAWCVLISILGIRSIQCRLAGCGHLQPSHHRGCKSTQLGTRLGSLGSNAVLSFALRSFTSEPHPSVATEQIDSVPGPSSTDLIPAPDDDSVLPTTSSETQPGPALPNDAGVLLDSTLVKMEVPQMHPARFTRVESVNTEGGLGRLGRVGGDMKQNAHTQPPAALCGRYATLKLCSNTTDPASIFESPGRFDPYGNAKPSERWILAQLLCLMILSKLRPQCVQQGHFWASPQTMTELSDSLRRPPKRSRFPTTSPRLSAARSSPRRHSRRIGKLFVLGSLFLYALSSGICPSGFSGFGCSDSGQSPSGTNSNSQGRNDEWSRHDPYRNIALLTRSEPEGTTGTDDIPGLPIHVQDAMASIPHIHISPPTPEQVDSSPTPPPPLDSNIPHQRVSTELPSGGVDYGIPSRGYIGNTIFPQPSLVGNNGVQTPHHPPVPQPPFPDPPPSQIPPTPGTSNRAEIQSNTPVQRTLAISIETLQRLAADFARNPHEERSSGTNTPSSDASASAYHQLVLTLGPPNPPVQPDLDAHGQRIYSRGYTDALDRGVVIILVRAQGNPQLVRAEPSAAHDSEAPTPSPPLAPIPQSNQAGMFPNLGPLAVSSEAPNEARSLPYAPPTPPYHATHIDPGRSSETLDASIDTAANSQAPRHETESSTQNGHRHNLESPRAAQSVVLNASSSSSQTPASAPSPAHSATYPSPPTPVTTPGSQGASDKTHICTECGEAFRRPYRLREHEAKHRGEKPFTCSFPGCNQTFAHKTNATRHLYDIHGEGQAGRTRSRRKSARRAKGGGGSDG